MVPNTANYFSFFSYTLFPVQVLQKTSTVVDMCMLRFWSPLQSQSLDLTFNPFSKISSALGPLTVQCTAIFSLRRIPKERTVYRALENTGFWPVRDSNTWCEEKINVQIQYHLTPIILLTARKLNWSHVYGSFLKRSQDVISTFKVMPLWHDCPN